MINKKINNHKKMIFGFTAFIILFLILNFTPPIMFANGWIQFGDRAENLEQHRLDEYNNFPFRREASNSDFDNFYFINLRFWNNMTVAQTAQDNNESVSWELIFPGIYKVEQNRKGSYVNSFEIKRGNSSWYCDYYATDI